MGIYVTDASGNRKKVAGIGKIKEIPDGSITEEKIADDSISTDKIIDDSVTWSKLAVDARPIRSNLLENWYFVGGGSQQGNEKLPINQRGKTEYVSTAYSIDRWIIRGNSIKCYFNDNKEFVMETVGGTVARGFMQCMGDFNEYAGKKVTISLLYKNLSGDAGRTVGFYLYGGNMANDVSISFGGCSSTNQNGLITKTITLPQESSYTYLNAYIFLKNYVANQSVILIAAKVELRDYQTLAHQDADGNWVINDIPHYGEELAKCQRYQLPILQWQNYPVDGMSPDRITICIPTPVTLRTTPTITSNFAVTDRTTGTIHYGFVPTCNYPSPGFIQVSLQKDAHGLSNAINVFCANAGVMIDANL